MSEIEVPHTPWLRMGGRVWRCAGCGQALGVVMGAALVVGVGIAIEESVRVRCLSCGQHQRWHASRPPADEERPPAIKTVG